MTFTRRTSAQAVPVCVRVLTAPPTLYLKSCCGLTVGSKTVAMFGYFALHAMWSLISWESLLALAE